MRTDDFAKGYSNIDVQEEVQPFIDYLKAVLENDQIIHYKVLMRRMMNLKKNGRYLEVGCGTGYDIAEIAKKLSSSGEAVGVDFSKGCLEYSQACYKEANLPLRFALGNAEDLRGDASKEYSRLEDNYFDACKTDRVLMHVGDPKRAISELKRVTKERGIVVVGEPDWGAFIINSDLNDISLKITNAMCSPESPVVKSPLIGRELYSHFVQCGFHHIDVTILNIPFYTLEEFNPIIPLDSFLEHALKIKAITEDEEKNFRKNLQKKDEQGEFFANYCFFIVKGEA